MLNSYEYLKLLAPRLKDELIVTTISGVRRELYNVHHSDANFYHVYMSGASALALGMAASLPHRKVICLEGDGSVLMGLSALPAIATHKPSNLIIIVFDNESYMACSLPTFTAGVTDLAGIAGKAGIPNTFTVRDGEEFQKALDAAYQAKGPSYIVAKSKMERVPLKNAPFEGVENKYRFVRYIEQSENVQIIKPPAVKKLAGQKKS